MTDSISTVREAVAAAPYLLPPTPAIFGRLGKPDSHWIYYTDLIGNPSIQSAAFQYKDPTDGKVMLELRIGGSAGAQTVFPPSIHKDTGEPIRWINGHDPEPAAVAGPEMLTRVRRLAAATLLGRHWPQVSGMHNCARMLGGMLRRAGYGHGDIAIFTEAAARAGRDPNIKDKLRTARDAAEGFDAGKKTEGLPTLEKKFGQDISRAIIEWLGLGRGQASAAATATGQRPRIRLGPNLTAVAAETEQTIIAAGLHAYGRDTLIVRPRITGAGDTRSAKLIPVGVPMMRSLMDMAADFEKYDGRAKGFVQCKPPIDVAEIVLDRAELLPVSGMILAASMRPDGSLITQPGYDRATGLYLVDPPAMPAVPDRPDGAAAMNALALFDRLLKDFTFTDDHSKAVALSALITPIVRPALGRVPLHAVTAPDSGCGKSYLVHIASAIATGQAPAAITAGGDLGEMEKRLDVALLDAAPIVMLDNVTSTLRGDYLCAFIEQPKVKVRLLGHSKAVDIVPLCTPFVTGINLQISGDLIRRTLRCSIDPKQENAWEREFSGNPVDTVLADRGKYVAAALTIARSWLATGDAPLKPLPSFERWSNLVRSPLVWLGCKDPVDTIGTLRDADPEREQFEGVVVVWEAAFGLSADVLVAGVISVASDAG